VAVVDVDRVLEQHGGGLRTASRAASTSRERLVAALAYLIRARCSGPRLLREGGVSLTIDQLSQTRSAFFRHFFSPLQQVLDDGVRSGELRSMDTAFAAQALLNLVDPWTGREARPGGRSAEELASDIVDLVVDGIAQRQDGVLSVRAIGVRALPALGHHVPSHDFG